MQKSHVLISPDFQKPYIIQKDASKKGLGFGGRVLSKSEFNYRTTTEELLAIYFSVKQNEVYLMNSNFIIGITKSCDQPRPSKTSHDHSRPPKTTNDQA